MPEENLTSGMLDTEEAASYVRLPKRTMEFFRATGRGPVYRKVGRRVFYSRARLDEWLSSCEVDTAAR